MGESGSRRSTIVSRLPIFRRSVNKRQDSLPSSPSSGGIGNGVHTSSPSSTNSSSSSTGKRRSLFRAPSISFHSKRSSEPRINPSQLSLDSRSHTSDQGVHDGSGAKTRHSFGFGGHKHKKITRSQTEDFEKTSTNRNVFINCISSGTNEGDDSGFLDDVSSRRSSRHKKLLPKSFSAHHRFSKTSSNVPDQGKVPEGGEPPKTGTPGSWPGELGESSLQSPMLSEDRTTAITPSDFVHVTEDSVSEVDALPAPSPAAPNPPAPPETFADVVSTSQVFFSPPEPATEKPLLPDTSNTAITQCESTTVPSEPTTLQTVEELRPEQVETENEQAAELSEESSSNPEPKERRLRNLFYVQGAGRTASLGKGESRPTHLRKPHTMSVCSSVSPYHEVMRMERRLRSASEGAGGPRLHLSLREPNSVESNTLAKQRTNSSSSKMGSLDVLNNLGSSELDEDDLMLDLDLSDDQRHRHVSRENSSQSLASCLNLLHSPMEPTAERTLRDPTHRPCSSREPRPMSLCLPGEEELLPGLEGLPFRLMQQDCTAVKTLLLRLRRTLQESNETSPASSLHSLPISPCSEKSLPLKDPGREEWQSLQQQLKEKDEVILQLQTELEIVRGTQKPLCQKTDKTTQTDLTVPEVSHPSRVISQNSSARDRRPARSLAVDQFSRPPAERATACDERTCPNPSSCHASSAAAIQRRAEGGPPSEAAVHRKTDYPASQIPRAVLGSSTSLQSRGSPSRSLSSDSERCGGLQSRSERSANSLSRPSSSSAAATSSFAGRLGQPPRGPLSLHMYSRKNVFLQHSLHTAELQALAQQDG
ncbi:serine-rich coiled-coil domain-containing protein 1 [Chanos chanos]|uniref:Serine-rich coiled-coil domain-containing protein 1 n=1 Tax=Chanos chanos TaxID=29144 RepID=A0A6J2UNS5_CHACN|nr:serine-rich coiled-coil domain-containing protein 1 [Chanos chanos]